MIGLAIRALLGGLWGRLWAFFSGALAFTLRVQVPLLVPLLCGAVALFTAHGWHGETRLVEQLRAQAAQFAEAQKRAGELAQEALHHQEALYQQKAKEADDAYHSSLASADARAAAYIAAHRIDRVRPGGASSAGATASPAQSAGTQGGDGPGAAADLVAVTPADIEVCTINTKRLQAVRDWALSLNAEPAQERATDGH